MHEKEKIELSSMESTAYWWIKIIKNKVRELIIQGTTEKEEIKFVKIFYNYTEVEWRNLYLGLVNYITEDVNNYVPIENMGGTDTFNQDTDKNGHDRINTELSKIINCSIPDIRLANNSTKDSVIYTNMFGAYVWYKSGGVTKLPTKYEPCYILTGDEKELHFDNLLISTIAVLNELDRNFHSVSLIRERFCKEYKKVNKSKESIKAIKGRFNYSFDKACDKGIILGSSWQDTYFTNFRDIDFVGLEQYMVLAEHYANVILQKSKDTDGVSYSKKLKRNDNNINK